eukprot:3225548-Ditylum_brightwellii.AAC.1
MMSGAHVWAAAPGSNPGQSAHFSGGGEEASSDVDELPAILSKHVLNQSFEEEMIKNIQSAACTGNEQASNAVDPYKDVNKLEK